MLEVADVGQDPRLAAVEAASRETGIGSALAVPLMARGDVVGLLAAYPAGRPAAGEHETALLAALAGQLAVAVQNAQLHEQATRLGEEREAALAAERAAARRIRALYEVSRSFAQSLRLDETLEALARTVVEVLDIDAAVVRMPDERREQLLPRAVHIREAPFAERGTHDPHPARPVRPAERAAALPRAARLPARPRPQPRRAVLAGARPVSREGLDGGSRSRRPADRGRRLARHLLLPAGQPALAGDGRGGDGARGRRLLSRSTTRGSTSSRSSSPTRCSARCCRARAP